MRRVGFCDPSWGATCFAAFSLGGPTGTSDTGVSECPHDPGAVANQRVTTSVDMCLLATADTQGWQTAAVAAENPSCHPSEAIECAPSGSSADYYIVDNSLFELSGTVRTGHAPRAGVTVQARGPGGVHSTQTSPDGLYLFALHSGTYTVSVIKQRSKPRSRTVRLTRDRLGNDFEIPCGKSCKLKVFIKPLEHSRSGLAVHTQPYGLYPADFFVPGRGGVAVRIGMHRRGHHRGRSEHRQAGGGCDGDRVGDRFGKSTLRGDEAGTEQLCHNGECGQRAHLVGLQTDENGQLRVQYWAPGLVRPSRTTLKATARKVCSGAACPAREKEGSAKTSMNVSPYLIYTHSVTLSRDEAEELAAYGGGTGFFNRLLHTVTGEGLLAPPLEAAIGWLNLVEEALAKHIAALAALEAVGKLVFVAEVLKVGTELWERHGTIDLFLKALDLRPTGLDADPVEAAAPFISAQFHDDLISPHVVLPFGAGATGVAFHLASFLHERQQAHPHEFEHTRWQLSVKIHEISFCNPAKGACGPGGGDRGYEPGRQSRHRADAVDGLRAQGRQRPSQHVRRHPRNAVRRRRMDGTTPRLRDLTPPA